MALDIGLQSKEKGFPYLNWPNVVSLEYPEYSFLSSYFEEFKNKTGIKITDCSDAKIQGQQLVLFSAIIHKAIEEVKLKPNLWEQHIGWSSHPKKQNSATMEKREFLEKLNHLANLINQAIQKNEILFFVGD